MSSALLGGFVLGFVIAAGPGPISLLTARRTLTGGWAVGIVSGLGVATADAFYAALAVLGVGAISTFLTGSRRLLEVAGGLALMAVGVFALRFRKRLTLSAEAPTPVTLAGAYLTILGLTIANPSTILSFAAVAAGFDLHLGAGAVLFVVGVLAGSAAWWLILTAIVHSLRRRLADAWGTRLATASGALILVLGLLATGRGLAG